MAKSKSTVSVIIHPRPNKSTGTTSLALHWTYDGIRDRKNTGLLLVPEIDKASKEANKETWKRAEAMRAQKYLELINRQAGINPTVTKGKTPLITVLEEYKDKRLKYGQSPSMARTVNNVILHIKAYKGDKGDKVMIKQVDKAFCEGFILYLANCKTVGTDKPKQGEHKPKPMAKTTAHLYFSTFVSALNYAVENEYLEKNPASRLSKTDKKPVKLQKTNRTYLNSEELQALAEAKCPNEELRRAFFFSCICALRFSDVQKLTWGEITVEGKFVRIKTTQKKTNDPINNLVPKDILFYLPERGSAKDTDIVFAQLPTQSTVNDDMKVWAKRAKITKQVGFHTARHICLTNLSKVTKDLKFVSKFAGHKSISPTDKYYVEVMEESKEEAAEAMTGFFAEYANKPQSRD